MKRLLALILALLMMMTVFVGCGSEAEEEIDATETDDAVISEPTNFNLQFNAFYDDNGERLFTVEETFSETPEVVEYNNIGYVFMEKAKVSDILAENYAQNLEIVDDNGTFLGWMIYEWKSDIDEFGNDMGGFKKVDDTLYTTEQILEMEIDCTVEFVAKWSDIDESAYTEYGY